MRLLHAQERTNYPLALSVDDLGEGFVLSAQVHRSIDPQRICAFMHEALQQLVSALEQQPHTTLAHLDILPAAEREQIAGAVEPHRGGLSGRAVHP